MLRVSIGERLLDLTEEYRESKFTRSETWVGVDGAKVLVVIPR